MDNMRGDCQTRANINIPRSSSSSEDKLTCTRHRGFAMIHVPSQTDGIPVDVAGGRAVSPELRRRRRGCGVDAIRRPISRPAVTMPAAGV